MLNWANLQNALAIAKAEFGALFEQLLENADWNQVTEVSPRSSITTDLSHLGFFPAARRWIGDKHLKKMRAYTYRVTSEEYEATIEIAKRTIREAERSGQADLNQALGLPTVMRRLSISANALYDKLAFEALSEGHNSTHSVSGDTITCFDGQPYFDTAHPNGDQSTYSNEDESGAVDAWFLGDSRVPPTMLLEVERPFIATVTDPNSSSYVFKTGKWLMGWEADMGVAYTVPQAWYRSTATFSEANLDAHAVIMAGYVNDQGEPMDVMGDTIVYGPSNQTTIEELIKENRKGGGDSNNRFFGQYKLVKSNRL
jgi:phage major head subunit gpT-like protein